MRLRYVNRNHIHRLYGQEGLKLCQGKGPGPHNTMVRLDSGEIVIAPWGNWRAVKGKHKEQCQLFQ